MVLEPDLYPKHKALMVRLLRDKRWIQITEEPEPEVELEEPDDGDDEPHLLPHQLEVVEKLRRAKTQIVTSVPGELP